MKIQHTRFLLFLFLLVVVVSHGASAAAPTATTEPPTSVTAGSATLNGSGNPNGAASTGWFRYDATDPGSCNDSFGTRAPAAGGDSLGSGTSPVSYSESISGLNAGTPYYYCAIVQSAEGTGFGSVLSFTTDDAPSVTTDAATDVTSSSVTFNGTANPNGASSYAFFRFSTTNPGACNDSFGTRWPTFSSSDTYLGSGSSPVAFALSRTGLPPGTTHYYCALARNAYGTSWGAVQSFTTDAAPPDVTTNSATQLTGTTAQLNGTANPNGAVTTGWFRYDTVSPGTCNDSFGTRAPVSGGDPLGSGGAPVAYSEPISGLTGGMTYYSCAIAQNVEGVGFGSVLSFTPDDPPAVDSTIPADGTTDVWLDAEITVIFTEDVTVTSWFAISCSASGTHTAAERGGPLTYTLDPDFDFDVGEQCTVSIYADGVSDNDPHDPPDVMVDDHVFSFFAGSSLQLIFDDGFESGDTSRWASATGGESAP